MQAGYDDLKANFRQGIDNIKNGLATQRSMNDKICYLLFVIIMLTFIILGIVVMADQSQSLKNLIKTSSQNSSNIIGIVFSKYYGLLVVMFILSLIMSIFYLTMLRFYPKCMIYTLVIFVLCVLFSIMILCIAYSNYGFAVAIAIGIVFMLIYIYCVKDQIETGINLLKLSGAFVSQRKSVYCASIWVFFLSLLFFIFWAVSVVAVQLRGNEHLDQNKSTDSDTGIFAYFIFTYIFMTIFFYYVLTFLIATACGTWYYGEDDNYCLTGVGRINKYHIGSFTFASLILSFVKILQIIVNSSGQNSDNAFARCVQCFVSCVLRTIEHILRALNNVSIIIMAVTGESYCDSAKNAAFVLLDNLPLYSVVSLMSNFIIFGGVLFSVSLPTVIGMLYCSKNLNPTDKQLQHLGLVIFFGTIMLVIFFVGTLIQSLNSIFVFYCLDLKLNQCGCIMATPELLKEFKQYGTVNENANSAYQLKQHKNV